MRKKKERVIALALAGFMALNLSGFAISTDSMEDAVVSHITNAMQPEESLSSAIEESQTSEAPFEEELSAQESSETVQESSEPEIVDSEACAETSMVPEETQSSTIVVSAVEDSSKTSSEVAAPAVQEPKKNSASSLPAVKATQEEGLSEVPREQDYAFSGGAISGLTSAYLAGLTEEQKAKLQLIIPASINGVAVTSIAKDAFKFGKYAGCTFVSLDLSNAVSLKTIGDYAFYNNSKMTGQIILPAGLTNIGQWAFSGASALTGTLTLPENLTTISTHAFDGCASLTGSLVVPNSVTTMGTYAFSNCKGMTGTLTLSEGVTAIPDYVFAYAGFTGSLVIPETVKTIGASAFRQGNAYNGFSGHLSIPEGVISVGKVAFSYQKALTSVSLPSTLKVLNDSVFSYTGLSGVLRIPDVIESIGASTFAYTQLTAVYLPSNAVQASYWKDSSFKSITTLNVIVCSKDGYDQLGSVLGKTEKAKLAYPVTVSFADGGFAPLERLYKQQLNLVKQTDDSWQVDSSYQLPQQESVQGMIKGWSFDSTALSRIAETAKVEGSTLYSISAPVDPELTFSDDLDFVYDGKEHPLTVTATHPLAKPIGSAKAGDVVFYYQWYWGVIGTPTVELKGFDETVYNVVDVRQPQTSIICSVQVQACLVNDQNKAITFKTVTHDFGVWARRASPTVNPIYPTKLLRVADGMPEIQLAQGNTPGTIAWDAGQEPKDGVQEYSWTFQPEINAVGNTNYETKTGTAQLDFVNGEIFDLSVTSTGNGTVSPAGITEVGQGRDAVLTITPDPDHVVSEILCNGENITAKLKDGTLTLANVQQSCVIEVTFRALNQNTVEDAISQLPDITEGETPTDSQISSILTAKLNYELLGDQQDNLVDADREKLCNALMSLPQVSVTAPENAPSIENASSLMECMTAEDIRILAENPDASFAIGIESASVQPNETETIAIEEQLGDGQLAACLDLEVVKRISVGDQTTATPVSELKKEVQMVLNIPDQFIPSDDHIVREFFVIRLHQQGGVLQSSLLQDQDQDPNTITISSNQFSLYALAYQQTVLPTTYTIEASAGDHGSITPSGSVAVEEGKDQTFTFTPDNGYEVQSILVDGVGVGNTEAYRFTNVTAPHVIQVTFTQVTSSVPESSTPESSTPESSTPESSTPESSTPESSVPESSTPESSTPESSTPESSTPESSAPDSSVPESSVPESSVPESSEPASSSSQEEESSSGDILGTVNSQQDSEASADESKAGNGTQTGDESAFSFALIGFFLALCSAVAVIFTRRKKSDN